MPTIMPTSQYRAFLAISSIRSPNVKRATIIAVVAESSAIWGPKSLASHIMPGKSKAFNDSLKKIDEALMNLDNEEYGIALLKVKEIIGMMPITSVPQTPDYVKGVINLRGKVIPVVDLFGQRDQPVGLTAHRRHGNDNPVAIRQSRSNVGYQRF